MLARAVRDEVAVAGGRVLDVCTGSGVLAITTARCGAQATAVDVSRRAVLCAAVNARLNGVRIRALRGDLFVPVRGERFDVIVSNPPYLPADEELPARGAARAWEAGRDGRALLDRLCAQAPDHLAPGGVLLVVHSSLCDPGATLGALHAGGLQAEIVVCRRGPLGPLVRARAPELEARGLLIPGQRHEDVVIVRAASQPTVSPAASRGSPAGKEHQHGVEVGCWAHNRDRDA
jgi:release factor glutamine methyltransferase